MALLFHDFASVGPSEIYYCHKNNTPSFHLTTRQHLCWTHFYPNVTPFMKCFSFGPVCELFSKSNDLKQKMWMDTSNCLKRILKLSPLLFKNCCHIKIANAEDLTSSRFTEEACRSVRKKFFRIKKKFSFKLCRLSFNLRNKFEFVS